MFGFDHTCLVYLHVGPEGGEDTVEIEVKLACNYYPAQEATRTDPSWPDEVEAEPTHFHYMSLSQVSGKIEWIKFDMGSLDGDGYIYVLAEDWIEAHMDELVEAGYNAYRDHREYVGDCRA